MTPTLQNLSDALAILGKTTTEGTFGPYTALVWVSGDTTVHIYENDEATLHASFNLNGVLQGSWGFNNSCEPSQISACIDAWLASVA